MDEQFVVNTGIKMPIPATGPSTASTLPSAALSPFPAKTPLAMAYVPYQQYSAGYRPEEAYELGTLFPELNQPFYGERGFSV